MDLSFSTAPLWSYSLAALAYMVLVVAMLRQQDTGKRPGANWFLLLALSATAGWAIGGFFLSIHPLPLLNSAYVLFDSLRYGAWYGFIILLTYQQNGSTKTSRLRWPQLTGIAIICAGLGTQLLLAGMISPTDTLVRAAQYAALGQAIFGLVLLEQLLRNTTADSRWNIKPLGIGLLAAFAFDLYFHSMTLLFKQVDDDAFMVRGFAHALVLPLIALTIYRTRKRGFRVVLSKTAMFQTTSLAVAGLYLVAASAAGYYVRFIGGSWGGALQLAVLFSALVLLLLLAFSGTMRSRLRVFIGKHFLRYRYDYREEWLKFTNALASADDAQQIGKLVIHGLADMVESPGGALWLRDGNGQQYAQHARWNLPVSSCAEPVGSPLTEFLAASGWVINLEEYRHMPSRYRNLALPAWLTEIPNAWLIVPLCLANGMVGFVVLTTSRAAIDVNWEVNDLLQTAGRQAAAFLAQLQASEALLEARKFDSFNRMSAFVVHDLKNIVTQLSLMLRNAERHADNVEFQRDMLMTVRHSVDRMKQLMLQLREGTPSAAGTCGVDLGKIAEQVKAAKASHAPPVELAVNEKVLTRGHEERIERVIGHLVQNALEATDADGKVWIKVARENGMALVEVGDTGHGMSAEFLQNELFRPFKTTKQAGMGIGAYESQQYIRELGGDIAVESEENRGTCFRIKLPLFDSGAEPPPSTHGRTP